MIELFDKELNAQKESLKKIFQGSHKLPQEVCDENERSRNKEKNDAHVKLLLMEGSPL